MIQRSRRETKMQTRDYFRLGAINDRGIPGDLNEGTNGLPIYSANVANTMGFDHRYIVNYMKGSLGEPPSLKSYMGSTTINSILGMNITSKDTLGTYAGQKIPSLHSQIIAGYLMILDSETKGINIALACIGNTGIMSNPIDLFDSDNLYTEWGKVANTKDNTDAYTANNIIKTNTGVPSGEIGEVSKIIFGNGSATATECYIDVDGTVSTGSKNTDVAITSINTTDSDIFGIPYAVGLHNRFERFIRMVYDGDAGNNPLGGSIHSESYSNTVKLFCHQGSQPITSDSYTGGNLEGVAEGYPTALLSAITDYNRINVTLQVLREPYTDQDITTEWVVRLNSATAAMVTMELTQIGSTTAYEANWTLYIYNMDATNTPCLTQTFTPSTTDVLWNSTTRTYSVSFVTAARSDGSGFGLPITTQNIIRVEGIKHQ